jgi:hypothetical protein
VQERTNRTWSRSAEAYTQYSDLITQLMELNRKVGDASRLILDPELDSYYVMNATVLRIPEIVVDSGRYTDLSVLAAESGLADSGSAAQLTAARNRVATNATDLIDGLVKAFGNTTSPTLGPGLTRPLDDFRTAVDAVAPSNSLLAPAPERSLNDLTTDQDALQRAALTLQTAALGELDLLLSDRQDSTERSRLVTIGAAVLGLLVAGVAAVALRPSWLGGVGDDSDPEHAADRPAGRLAGRRRPAELAHTPPPRPTGERAGLGPAAGQPAPGLVGVLGPEQRGGARAAR